MPRTAPPALNAEIARRKALGLAPMTVAQIEARLRPLGYRLDRNLDCRSTARILAGPAAGISYPCLTTGIRDIETGASAFHFRGRRDARFKELQAFRLSEEAFAVVGGAILEL